MAKGMGFKRTGNSAIHNLLKNCLYAGLVKVNADRKTPERLVKGIHQPIISEADYWLTQEKLGLKRPSKSQPKEDFPLRGVLKCWCGKSMTAGFSKGRQKYYLYYRCIEHTETNISGITLHEKFEELLDELSFTKQQVDFIVQRSKQLLEEALSSNKKILVARQNQVLEIDRKSEKLEVRLMEDEIDGNTYKKWKQKYAIERALLQQEIDTTLSNEQTEKWNKLSKLLPQMTNIKTIYRAASAHRKQMLIKGVFKHNLTYFEGKFRTTSVEPAFTANALKAKEKGLLDLEEPLSYSDVIPSCTESGRFFEHLFAFMNGLDAIFY